MKLRVWVIRNVPNKPTYYPVNSMKEASVLINKMADRDLKNPNISNNAFGLEEFSDGEWSEHYNKHGDSIDDYMDALEN